MTLDTTDPQALAALFDACLDLEGEALEALLASAPPELAAKVRALLGHDAAAGAFLETPVVLRGPRPLQRIGRFELRESLGQGGMGVVYAAHDPQLDRSVAIKLLGGHGFDTEGRTRLVREAQALARVNHPNVVQVFEAGEHEGLVYVVMERVYGRTLREWLTSERDPPSRETPSRDTPRRDWRDTFEVLLQAGAGLAAVHGAGLCHRDVKPENVLVGDDGRARVVDFGLAGLSPEARAGTITEGPLDARLTAAGSVMGTPRYMAPEQWAGRVADAKSDQFAFAVTALEALAGAHPFREADLRGPVPGSAPSAPGAPLAGDSGRSAPRARPASDLEALRAAIQRGPRLPDRLVSELPGALLRALTRALSADPEARWPSMSLLLGELRRALAGHDHDLGIGKTARILVSTVICLLPPIGYTIARERLAAFGAGELLLMSLGMSLPVVAATLAAWRPLSRNAVNRRARLALLGAPLTLITSRALGWALDAPSAEILPRDTFALALMLSAAAVGVHHVLFVPALGGLALAFIGALFPNLILEAFTAFIALTAVSSVAAWWIGGGAKP